VKFQVIKYFILSRFTRPFVIGTIAFLILMIITYASLSKSIFEPRIISGLKVNFAEFVTFFVIFSGFSSTVQKADYDFLLPSPLTKSDVAFLYIIASMLLGGGYFIILGLIFLFIFPLGIGIMSLLSFSIFGIAVSSLSLIKEKLYLVVFTALWVWFPFFKIPYSPTEMLFGDPILGVLFSFVYSIPVLFRAVTDPQIQVTSEKGGKAKQIIKTPAGKNFLTKYFLLTYEFAWGYGSSLSGRKLFYYILSFPKILIISSIISVVYFTVFHFLLNYNFYTIMAPSVVILAFLMSMGIYSISQERPWLAFISLDRGSYLSKRIRIKTLQNALISLPFAVADALLGELSLGLTLFFGALLGYSVTAFLASKFNPIQFRGEVYNYRAGSGMLLIIFSEYFVMGISVIFGLFLVTSAIFTTLSAIVFLLLTRKGVWERISYELVEKGFV